MEENPWVVLIMMIVRGGSSGAALEAFGVEQEGAALAGKR
jgi:hypothetical protein